MKGLAIIKESVVAITNKPKDDAIRIDEVLLGMVVKVLWEDVNEYLYIETEYGYKGYIHMSKLIFDKDTIKKWTGEKKVIVTGEFADITFEMNFYSNVLKSAVRGSVLIATGESNKMRTRVGLPDGRLGWIRNEHVKAQEKPNFKDHELGLRNEIVANGKLYLDKQFRWGGKSPYGLDCSGFTSGVYLLSGICIWRDSEFKPDDFRAIELEELKPGDLIYGDAHTGLYIGDSKYIHASSECAKVMINSLNPLDDDYDDVFGSDEIICAQYKKFNED